MCNFKSLVCIKGETEPRWSDKFDSHGKLLDSLGLKDDALHLRKFVKIEYIPNKWGKNLEAPPRNKWTFKVDEESTLPGWFEDDRQLWEDRCWNVIDTLIPQIGKGVFPGDLSIYGDAKLDAPNLETVGGNLYINGDAKLDAPKLSKVNGKAYKHGN